MSDPLVVVLKAYRSNQEREAKATPLETKEVSTKAEFDKVTKDFYDRGLYVGYEGKSGVQLKSAAARFLLSD